MSSIVVSHLVGDQFEVAIRGHRLRVDQPVPDGGRDTGPTPTELFVSSLAACVAFYARRFLARHGLPTNGLGLEARYELAARPNRVGTIAISLRVPRGVPEDKLPALLAVARHCTVHNSLEAPPDVSIELAVAERAVA
jgi:putative redox protein